MTLERLNQHARLRRELEKEEDLKASLEEAVDLKAQVLTGMPTLRVIRINWAFLYR